MKTIIILKQRLLDLSANEKRLQLELTENEKELQLVRLALDAIRRENDSVSENESENDS